MARRILARVVHGPGATCAGRTVSVLRGRRAPPRPRGLAPHRRPRHNSVMNLLRSLSLLAPAALLAGAAAPLVRDNSTIPPAPGEVHAMLASKQPLARAIDAAEKDTAGLANEAVFGAGGVVTVHTYTPTDHFVVQVDSANGAVKSKEKRARFPGAAVEGEWTELKSGLKYYDLVVGTGPQPAGPTTTVKVHYTGWL